MTGSRLLPRARFNRTRRAVPGARGGATATRRSCAISRSLAVPAVGRKPTEERRQIRQAMRDQVGHVSLPLPPAADLQQPRCKQLSPLPVPQPLPHDRLQHSSLVFERHEDRAVGRVGLLPQRDGSANRAAVSACGAAPTARLASASAAASSRISCCPPRGDAELAATRLLLAESTRPRRKAARRRGAAGRRDAQRPRCTLEDLPHAPAVRLGLQLDAAWLSGKSYSVKRLICAKIASANAWS